jgi:hypothetical protein
VGALKGLAESVLRSAVREGEKKALQKHLNQVRSRTLQYIFWALLLGAVCAVLAPLSHGSWAGAATVVLWVLACTSCGAFAGFLFCIPKVLQNNRTDAEEGSEREPQSSETRADERKGAAPMGGAYLFQVNTNLEQISDWLCKIIVGLGLIELRNIPEHVLSLATGLSTDLGPGLTTSFAGGLIVYFVVIGFLGGYLVMRLGLAGELGRADREAIIGRDREERERVIDKVELAVARGEIVPSTPERVAAGGRVAETSPELLGIDDAIRKLVEVRAAAPADRRAAIVLSTLYAQKGDLKGAIEVLDSALRVKLGLGTDTDTDAGDLHFNKARYYLRLYFQETDKNLKKQWRDKMYASLEEAIRWNPANRHAVLDANDFRKFVNEPEFHRLFRMSDSAPLPSLEELISPSHVSSSPPVPPSAPPPGAAPKPARVSRSSAS